MLIRITSAKCIGINAYPVIVEVNVANGIGLHLVGLADAAVKESLLRTTTALQSMGLKVPGRRIVINLAPADMHKKGSGYDLPIALGIIAASEQLEMPDLGRYVIMGELGLDGTVRSIPGALPIVEMAQDSGFEGCILPRDSAMETLAFSKTKIYGVSSLADVLAVVCRSPKMESLLLTRSSLLECREEDAQGDASCMDFADIVGQEGAKRAMEIACAGKHHAIMVGPPGSGKSSLAKAMCRILPPMTMQEALQTSKIYSVAGRADLRPGNVCTRPFRAPHCSISATALIGGGGDSISPGEISLSHNGILYLDEFLELPKKTIEVLRAPLEDKRIVISRVRSKVEFPADFTLVAATNPCPCGYYGEGDRCTCSAGARNAYLAKLSGPIADRFDLQVWVAAVKTGSMLHRQKAESSAAVARRVAAARKIQELRFAAEGILYNSQMGNTHMDRYCKLTDECVEFLEQTGERTGMSARAFTRIIKLARTIADLETAAAWIADGIKGQPPLQDPIKLEHLAEAVSYRFLDRFV